MTKSERQSPLRQREHGFTVLELIVTLILLSLVSALLTASLRLGIRVWDRSDTANEAARQVYDVQSALRTLLEGVQPVRVRGEEQAPLDFSGLPQKLDMLVELPLHLGIGGLYRVEVATKPARRRSVLYLTVAPYSPSHNAEPLDGQDNQTMLLEGIDTIAFRYFGSTEGEDSPSWRTSWEHQKQRPTLIALEVAFPAGDPRRWQTLFVAPRLDEAGWK